jgi:HK97 family phage prohead protease
MKVSYGIQVEEHQYVPVQRVYAEDQMTKAQRDLEITKALLNIARVKVSLPRFRELDGMEQIIRERGATLSMTALIEIGKSVARIASALPKLRPTEHRSVQMPLLTRAVGDSRVVRFTASTPTVDRYNTIVKSEGIDTTRFKANPQFLWAHDGYGSLLGVPSMDSVIGRIISWKASPSAFVVDAEFAPASVNPRAQQALDLVRGKFLNSVSIGFIPKTWHEEVVDGRDTTVFDSVELLEISLCSIPANPEAIASRSRQAPAFSY